MKFVYVNKFTGGLITVLSGQKGDLVKVRRQGNATRLVSRKILKSNYQFLGSL